MTIDLSNPAHIEALRWACNQIRMRSVTLTADAAKLAALDAITDPILAADLLRRLLERRGVAVHEHSEPDWDGECEKEIVLRVDADGVWWQRYDTDSFLCDVPRVVLALLDATDRAAALAALRGER